LIDSEVIQIAQECRFEISDVYPLKLEASGREYYRIVDKAGKNLVLCYLDPSMGTHSKFEHVSKFFLDQGIRCPKVIYSNAALGVTIQEDLGDSCLIDIKSVSNENTELLNKSIAILVKIQTANVPQIPKLEQGSLLEQMTRFESIFIKDFLSVDVHKDLSSLKDQTIEELLNQPWMNCHFDFERRNLILLDDGDVAVVDYQDLCSGPIGIDLAGLFIDHYIKYSPKTLMSSLDYYGTLLKIDVDSESIFEWVRWGAIQRNMRILGTLSKIYLDTGRAFRLKDLKIILNNLIELIPDDNFKNLKNYLSGEVLQSLEIKMSQI
jgi:aminoglycoside/choline kinase family phosphotransferase